MRRSLVTAYDQPALGGVYKLTALRDKQCRWQHKMKLSEQAIKVSTPGILQVRRYRQDGEAIGDLIFDELTPIQGDAIMVDPLDPTRRKALPAVDQASRTDAAEDLLVPIFSRGSCVYAAPTLEASRHRLREQLALFHAGVKRFVNPHRYPVGLELGLHELKMALILKTRASVPEDA